MKARVFESWLLLLYFDYVMRFRGFARVHACVQRYNVRHREGQPMQSSDLCRAMDFACVLYFKRVLCLQRSAATTVLLRRHGLNAEMVIGTQMYPFRSHAWVELAGEVINDKPYMPGIFQELARC